MFVQANPNFHTKTQRQERSECVSSFSRSRVVGTSLPPSLPPPVQECKISVRRLGKSASDFCGLLANQRNCLAQICI